MKGRDKIKLKTTTIATKKRNRILNKIKTKHNNNNVNKLIGKRYKRYIHSKRERERQRERERENV